MVSWASSKQRISQKRFDIDPEPVSVKFDVSEIGGGMDLLFGILGFGSVGLGLLLMPKIVSDIQIQIVATLVVGGFNLFGIAAVIWTINKKTGWQDIVPATNQEQDLARETKFVEEGTYKGRKWRRFDDGTIEGELLGGRFKQFNTLEEFQQYIT